MHDIQKNKNNINNQNGERKVQVTHLKNQMIFFLFLSLDYEEKKIVIYIVIHSCNLFDFFIFTMLLMKYSPARYELRTSGPLAVYKNPSSVPISSHCLNLAGVTYSTTFKCLFVGCMYCPNVTQSTPLSRKSEIPKKSLII